VNFKKMNDFTIGDLGVFIGTIGGVVTSILIILQKSRCKKLKCCGCEVERDPKQLGDRDPNGDPIPKPTKAKPKAPPPELEYVEGDP
jgi:hypothetical protein